MGHRLGLTFLSGQKVELMMASYMVLTPGKENIRKGTSKLSQQRGCERDVE